MIYLLVTVMLQNTVIGSPASLQRKPLRPSLRQTDNVADSTKQLAGTMPLRQNTMPWLYSNHHVNGEHARRAQRLVQRS